MHRSLRWAATSNTNPSARLLRVFQSCPAQFPPLPVNRNHPPIPSLLHSSRLRTIRSVSMQRGEDSPFPTRSCLQPNCCLSRHSGLSAALPHRSMFPHYHRTCTRHTISGHPSTGSCSLPRSSRMHQEECPRLPVSLATRYRTCCSIPRRPYRSSLFL